MAERKAHITARIPPEHLEELKELQRQHRRETGEDVRLADQVRDAVAEYLERRCGGKEKDDERDAGRD